MKKRRLLSIVLSLCMVLALMPQMVFADTISGTTADGFSYTISDAGKVTIIGYTGSATDVGRILRTFKIKKNVEVTDNGKIII